MPNKQMIQSPEAPQPVGPYSQAIKTNNLIFLAGQLGIDPLSGKIEETTIEGQTKRTLQNMEAILKTANLTLEDVLKCEIFMLDLKDFNTMNAIYSDFFCYPIKPARQTIQVARLPLDALIEISCIAVVP